MNNRDRMPQVAEIVDAFRAVFGDVKVKYACENGIEIGKKTEGGVVPVLPLEMSDVRKANGRKSHRDR